MQIRGMNFLSRLSNRINKFGSGIVMAKEVKKGCLTVYGLPNVWTTNLIHSQNCVLCADIVFPAKCKPNPNESPLTMFNHCSFYEKHIGVDRTQGVKMSYKTIKKCPAYELNSLIWSDYELVFNSYGFNDMTFGYNANLLQKSARNKKLRNSKISRMVKRSYYRPTKFFNAAEEDIIYSIVIDFMEKYCG